MNKNMLVEKMMGSPLDFSQSDFDNLVACYKNSDGSYSSPLAFSDMRECVRRIYDLNEAQLMETSNAKTGMLGKLNRRSTRMRQNEYYKRVEKQKPGKQYTRIYAEGDSWFLFPWFVTDVIDWLFKRNDYLIYSEAYGGDWITNIIYEGQYVEGITVHSPDIFLISGGGNDLVGNNRMAVMVSQQANQRAKYGNGNLPNADLLTKEVYSSVMTAQPYITKEFYAFIHAMHVQYTLLFKSLYAGNSKHKNMVSITQGYAYPYPKKGSNYSLRYPLQPIVNSFLCSGQWLFRPLMIKGIADPVLQRAIVTTFIYEFNAMLAGIAGNPEFPNVYHIDCCGIPACQDDWYDELHLKSNTYKKVANFYQMVIDNRHSKLPKVIKA